VRDGVALAADGRAEWIAARVRRATPRACGGRWAAFAETARHDLVAAGGFLVLGALVAAVLSVLTPPAWLDALAGQLVLAVLVMAVLAVVLALCSEADAFVAASLSTLPLLPRLVFLVVGPAVDVKLIALQAGTFGRRAIRPRHVRRGGAVRRRGRGAAAVRRETQHVLLLLLGGAVARIAIDDTYLRYVHPSHGWLLLAAGAVIAVLAVTGLLSDRAGTSPGHRHGPAERYAPWLLLAPVLVIALVAPPALGADAVSRAGARIPVVQESDVFAPPGGPVELSVAEFVQRAAWTPPARWTVARWC
jgi:hypothetical protein